MPVVRDGGTRQLVPDKIHEHRSPQMIAAAQPEVERSEVRTIVGGGAVLGGLTAVGVVTFALLARALQGTLETVMQSIVVLAGAGLASYLPAAWLRPRSADAIAWAALTGLIGALCFTVVDTVVLRPLGIYHWRWDAVGGGSGFWYIPVWWMSAATLAWLGAWVVTLAAESSVEVAAMRSAGITLALSVAVCAILVATRVAPLHAAVVALAYAVGLVLSLLLTSALSRR